MFRISCLLIYYYMYRGGTKLGENGAFGPTNNRDLFFWKIHIYHNQILSLEANFSLKDMK